MTTSCFWAGGLAAAALMGASGLAACTTTQPLAQAPSSPSLVYRCPDGKSFTAAYEVAEPGRATVTAGGRVYILPQVISASGVRYEQDGVELRTKGAWAMLTGAQGGPYDECQTTN